MVCTCLENLKIRRKEIVFAPTSFWPICGLAFALAVTVETQCAWVGGELQLLDYPLSVLPLLSVPVSLCVVVLPLWGVVLAALAVLFGVRHNRVWLCVRAYLPAYAADGALAPLVETTSY